MEWLPAFANFRRDGYDFDARWDDGLANIRHKRIMDCFEENPDGGITEYYRNCKCRRTLDFTGHFKTFSVMGYPKWKKLFNSGTVKNKFFTGQICAYTQIRRLWQEWGIYMGQKIQKSKNGLQVQNLIFVFLYC